MGLTASKRPSAGSGEFAVGDRVKIKPELTSVTYGWGSVTKTSVGVVAAVMQRDLRVDFPEQTGWLGLAAEMTHEVEVQPVDQDQSESLHRIAALFSERAEMWGNCVPPLDTEFWMPNEQDELTAMFCSALSEGITSLQIAYFLESLLLNFGKKLPEEARLSPRDCFDQHLRAARAVVLPAMAAFEIMDAAGVKYEDMFRSNLCGRFVLDDKVSSFHLLIGSGNSGEGEGDGGGAAAAAGGEEDGGVSKNRRRAGITAGGGAARRLGPAADALTRALSGASASSTSSSKKSFDSPSFLFPTLQVVKGDQPIVLLTYRVMQQSQTFLDNLYPYFMQTIVESRNHRKRLSVDNLRDFGPFVADADTEGFFQELLTRTQDFYTAFALKLNREGLGYFSQVKSILQYEEQLWKEWVTPTFVAKIVSTAQNALISSSVLKSELPELKSICERALAAIDVVDIRPSSLPSEWIECVELFGTSATPVPSSAA